MMSCCWILIWLESETKDETFRNQVWWMCNCCECDKEIKSQRKDWSFVTKNTVGIGGGWEGGSYGSTNSVDPPPHDTKTLISGPYDEL